MKTKNKQINKDAQIFDLCLFLRKSKTLILGDLHIGFEEAVQKEGILLPKFHFKDIYERINNTINELKPKIIILNGDIKHEFGTISEEEWRNTLKIIDLLSEKAELILIKGNHDAILEPIANKKSIIIKEYYVIGTNYVCHGHKLPKNEEFKKSKSIIISHDHPAVTLRDGPRNEKFKCFLKGHYEDKEIIVLPAFSGLSTGSDILKEKMMSPFLNNIDKFRIYIVEDKIYDFGMVKDLRNRQNTI